MRPIQPFHQLHNVSHGEVLEAPDPPDPHDTAFNHEYARFAIATSGEVENNVLGLAY